MAARVVSAGTSASPGACAGVENFLTFRTDQLTDKRFTKNMSSAPLRHHRAHPYEVQLNNCNLDPITLIVYSWESVLRPSATRRASGMESFARPAYGTVMKYDVVMWMALHIYSLSQLPICELERFTVHKQHGVPFRRTCSTDHKQGRQTLTKPTQAMKSSHPSP